MKNLKTIARLLFSLPLLSLSCERFCQVPLNLPLAAHTGWAQRALHGRGLRA
jgi:hypothetical protein